MCTMKTHATLLLFASVLLLFKLIASQYIGELTTQHFTTHVYNAYESSSDNAKWTFRVPPEGVCVRNLTMFTVAGRRNGERLSFHLDCDRIVGRLQLDTSVNETEIVYPLTGVSGDADITVSYQRFIRTMALQIGHKEKLRTRLIGRVFKFTPWKVTIYYHPAVCLKSLSFNRQNVLVRTKYPACSFNDYYEPANESAIERTIVSGHSLNIAPLIHDYMSCSLALISKLQYGRLKSRSNLIYEHDGISNNITEKVWFDVSCDGNSHRILYIFVTVSPVVLSANVLDVEILSWRTVINSSYINSSVVDAGLDYHVTFVVRNTTVNGVLLRNGKVLQANHNFSQTDVNENRISFQVFGGTQAFHEVMPLIALVSGVGTSLAVNLTLSYRPSFDLNLHTLHVIEGGYANISQSVLNVRYGVSQSVSFEVLERPKHGKITSIQSQATVEEFTNQYIIDSLLVYHHDDSETTDDNLTLRVRPNPAPTNEQVEVIVVLRVKITLVNDNQPIRKTADVITVVTGLDTFLSSADISYIDADIHQGSEDISFERQGIICGEIIHLPSSTNMYKFTQADVNSGELIFRHSPGYLSCKLVVWISDGEHVFSDILLIKDVEHNFIINGSQTLLVGLGEVANVDSRTLGIFSNTRTPASEIIIELKRFPHHGDITLPESSTHFTYQDVLNGKLQYTHHGALSVSDTFSLKININEAIFSQIINIVIDTDPALLKPHIQHNFPIAGRIGDFVNISTQILLVSHSQASPSEIRFQIPSQRNEQTTPFYVRKSSLSVSCNTFTQDDIDNNRIFYNIKAKSRPSTILVSFRGVSTDLVFTQIIIKDYIEIKAAQGLDIKEGSYIALNESLITPADSALRNNLLRVLIRMPSSHLTFYYNLTRPTQDFWWTDLVEGKISILHDHSETLTLNFHCKLVYLEAMSSEQEVTVTVEPINDHPPTFNRTGQLSPLVLWIGSNGTRLTNRSMLIEDGDGDASTDSLVYHLTSLRKGIVLRDGIPSDQFSQADVDNGAIVYQYQNSEDSAEEVIYLPLTITDGKHTTGAIVHIAFMKQNVKIVCSEILQAFPSSPSTFSSSYLLFQQPGFANMVTDLEFAVKSRPTHGSISPLDQQYWIYTPELSDHLHSKMCSNISHSVSDKVVFSATHKRQTNVDIVLHINISYLNMHHDFFLNNSSTIEVKADDRVTLTESMLSSGPELTQLLWSCGKGIGLGFRVELPSKSCKVRGLSLDYIMWWEKVKLLEYELLCSSSKNQTPQLILQAVFKQNNRFHFIDGFKLEIPINIWNNLPTMLSELVSMTSEQPESLGRDDRNRRFNFSVDNPDEVKPLDLSVSVGLLQGHRTVAVANEILQDLRFYSKDAEFVLSKYPQYGEIFLLSRSNTTVRSFTRANLLTNQVYYRQTILSKHDMFQLMSDYNQYIDVYIYALPNVVPTGPMVVENGNPILITIESLDASPLLQYSVEDPAYHITKSPIFGKLKRRTHRQTRDLTDSITEFRHTDILNELILYYPPGYVPEEEEDNFTYTLVSVNVPPADGIFTVKFNTSRNSTGSVQLLETGYQGQKELPKTTLLIIIVMVCLSIFGILILSAVLCLRHSENRKKKQMAKQEMLNAEPRLVLTKENGSYKLLVTGGDELEFPSRSLSLSPSRKIDPEKESEVCLNVPQVRVTPLVDKDGTTYDLHDYVNCEDIQCFAPSQSSQLNSSAASTRSCEHSDSLDAMMYESIERMPPITKPNYLN